MNDESPHLSLEDLIQRTEGGASPYEEHLANCQTCQARVRDWDQISAAVSIAVGTAKPPPRLIDEVLASIDQSPALKRSRRRTASGRRARVGSVAALVVVGLGAFGLTFAFDPSTGVAGASASVLGRSVKLPHGLRLVSMSGSSCHPWAAAITIRRPVDITDTSASTYRADAHGQFQVQGVGNLIKESSEKQACIQSSESAPYTLPIGVSPTTPFIPAKLGGSPISIDGHYAEVVSITDSAAANTVTSADPSDPAWVQVACGSSPPGGPSGAKRGVWCKRSRSLRGEWSLRGAQHGRARSLRGERSLRGAQHSRALPIPSA